LALAASGADKVVLRIRAGNPLDRPQTVNIRSNLPAGVTTNDIISLGGLELGYEVRSGTYFVRKSIELGPKEIVEYGVDLQDRWQIPPESLSLVAEKAEKLAGQLRTGDSRENADALARAVADAIADVRARQAKNQIKAGVPVVDHIRAYEMNAALLKQARRDLGRLETLAIAADVDPGGLHGESDAPPPPAYRPRETGEGPTVTFQIRVQNASTTEVRRVDIRRELPPEIGVADIVDPAGLQYAVDPRTGICYVWMNGVQLDPGAARVFVVRVRDRWNVNGPRVRDLTGLATNLQARIRVAAKYKSIGAMLDQIAAELQGIGAEAGPADVNDRYVAFYRDQAARLNVVEEKLRRIDALLRPIRRPKIGFDLQAPNLKTTWLVIWGILGFLGVISLLFFLRWYGRSKSE
jgi:hypothetical protein